MARDYRLWCEQRHHRATASAGRAAGRCWRLDGRYKIAFDIALGSQWDGFASEMRGLVDPAVVRVTLLSALVGYMALIAFPELVTKGIAAGLALALTAYLGAEAVWDLVAGWIRMVQEADSARTFADLQLGGDATAARWARRLGAAAGDDGGRDPRGGWHGGEADWATRGGAGPGQLAADGGGLGRQPRDRRPPYWWRRAESRSCSRPEHRRWRWRRRTAEARRRTPRPATEDEGPRYKSFDAFKRANGPAGEGKVWHHIVEQHKDNVAKFGPEHFTTETTSSVWIPRRT